MPLVFAIQKIIRAVNANGTVHARYSTPSDYVQAKLAENITYSVKTDDFFPYISDPQSVWTGYFTSRPGLKGYVRSSSVLLQVARQLEVLAGSDRRLVGNGTEPLWEALSIAQHHGNNHNTHTLYHTQQHRYLIIPHIGCGIDPLFRLTYCSCQTV